MRKAITILSILLLTAITTFSQSIESKIREFARNEYPSDSKMQDYVYKKQISAYRYMQSVTDSEVKKIAIREYYNDYAMQKYTYNKQFSAKTKLFFSHIKFFGFVS